MISVLLALTLVSAPLQETAPTANQKVSFTLEDSVVPFVEKMEDASYLNPKKYAKNQWNEISAGLSRKEDRIRLVSYNFLHSELDKREKEINQWPQRLPRVLASVREMDPDLIGSQELSSIQVEDLMKDLGDVYAFYGLPRKLNVTVEEINGFFYRKERFEVLSSQVFKIPGMEKDQTVTSLQLKDLKTGKSFTLYTMHMSFVDPQNREKEATYVSNLLKSHKAPVIFLGDLNTFPNHPEDPLFPAYDGDYIHRILTRYDLKDAEDLSLLGHVGPLGTFTNVPPRKTGFEGTGTPGVVLDHIYLSPGISVLIHATQPVRVDHHFPSDHMPIFIDIIID